MATRSMILLMAVVVLGLIGPPAFAELKAPPTGKEIAVRAKKVKLQRQGAAAGDIGKKTIAFTPSDLRHVKSDREVEDGLVIGRLDTKVTDRSEVNLAPGNYNVFLAKVRGEWHVYAEANGKVAHEFTGVTVEKGKEPGPTKAVFHHEGKWWVKICVWVFCVSFGGG